MRKFVSSISKDVVKEYRMDMLVNDMDLFIFMVYAQ